MVGVGVLSSQIAFFDIFLGIVPCSTRVGHEDSENETCAETSDEETENTGNAENDTYEDRCENCDDRRNEHLVLCGLCRDFNAALVVRSTLTGEDALDLVELTTYFDNHLLCGATDSIHCKTAEEEGHHRTDEDTGKD